MFPEWSSYQPGAVPEKMELVGCGAVLKPWSKHTGKLEPEVQVTQKPCWNQPLSTFLD